MNGRTEHEALRGACGCGRVGRLWLLGRDWICGACLLQEELRIARRIEAGELQAPWRRRLGG